MTSPESGSSRWAAREGHPFPLGPTKIEEDDAYNFALYSKHSEKQVRSAELAGESIRTILTRALGNNAPVGGLTVITGGGWFAARPSGTEDIYKIHAQSFRAAGYLHRILAETQTIVSDALAVSPAEAEMKGVRRLSGASGGYVYVAAVSAAPHQRSIRCA